MRFKLISLSLILITLFLSTVAVILILRNWNIQNSILNSQYEQATISGNFNINGVIPPNASISISQKIMNSQTPSTVFAANLPIVDRGAWSFNNAISKKNYEIQAQIIVNGQTIATSNVLSVTAPADDEVLTFNLPNNSTKANAVISGNIDVNGYIPNNSTIKIEGRKLGAKTFVTVAPSLPGKTQQFLSYNTAIAGETYEVQGTLLDSNGNTIGTSNILTVTAPALNENLVINSSATLPASPTPLPALSQTPIPTQPPTQTSISGNINLNGAAPSNSRIVILMAPLNSTNYTVVVNNISPTDGASWIWNGAQNSTWYSLIAVLKQHNANGTDTDIATSAPQTVAAPAANVVFTLNSGISLSAPGGPISVNCQTYNGGPNQNTWNVSITFQSVPNAQSYWYQVGNTSGSNNLINTATQANTINAVFNNNTTYYASYAYANVPIAPLGSPQWSAFSSSTPLQCSH